MLLALCCCSILTLTLLGSMVLAVPETQAGFLHIQALSKGNYQGRCLGARCTDGMARL